MSKNRLEANDDNLNDQGDHNSDTQVLLIEQRAKSLVAMGLVAREGDRFRVKTAAMRDRQKDFEVWRDETGRVRCSCPKFEETAGANPAFRCEHILAVKHSLTAGTASNDQNSASNEGQAPEVTHEASDQREQLRSETEAESSPQGRVEPPAFVNLLERLSQPIEPRLIKTREGWTDRSGQKHMVEYVEWHTVADMLDQVAPHWSHAVRSIKQIGDLVAVTAAITIDNVTREGIGTGPADSEMGIKKAEHDALKRAAVKFGIARDLYQRESEVIEEDEILPSRPGLPRDPLARTLAELVTPKQLGMIRALGRAIGCDVEQECRTLMQCGTEGLSKRAASSLIDHLKRKQQEMEQEGQDKEFRQAS
jgi:Rad52/22 family double-strand break repair protein